MTFAFDSEQTEYQMVCEMNRKLMDSVEKTEARATTAEHRVKELEDRIKVLENTIPNEMVEEILGLVYRATTAEAEAAAMRGAIPALLSYMPDFVGTSNIGRCKSCGTLTVSGSIHYCMKCTWKLSHQALSSTAGKALLEERDALKEVRDAAEKVEFAYWSTHGEDEQDGCECKCCTTMRILTQALAKAKEVAHD